MNKKQSNRLRMLIGVSAYLAENTEIVTEIPEMSAAKNNLDGIISDINYNLNVSNTALFGKTEDKLTAHADVIKYVMALTGGLYAWAIKTGNNEIKSAANLSRSDFGKIRESEFAIVVKDLVERSKEKAKDDSQELADFGVTEELITILENYLENYSSALGKREAYFGKRTGAVRSLKELFSDSINALAVLDKFAVLQSLKHKTFYHEYLVVRRIKNIGEHSAKAQPVTEVSNPTLPRAS